MHQFWASIIWLIAVCCFIDGAIAQSRRGQDEDQGQRVTQILDSLLQGYDKRVRPNYGNEPVTVGVTLFVIGISSFSTENMEWTADFYFRQMWKDPRLAFSGPLKSITVGPSFFKNIWMPDTFFVNEKSSIPTDESGNAMFRIMDNGEVLFSKRVKKTFDCPMDLQFFPMDSQVCGFELESFGWTMTDVQYEWAKGPASVGISDDIVIPGVNVGGHREGNMSISLSTGNYSRMFCEVDFVRKTGYYIVQVFIPVIFIVVTSWVVFWIPRDELTSRVLISLACIMTMTFTVTNINSNTVKISYTKSIDVFTGVSLLMVFLVLLEIATVAYITQLKKKLASKSNDSTDEPEVSETEGNKRKLIVKKITNSINPSIFDHISRIAFPLVYVIFNIAFWLKDRR